MYKINKAYKNTLNVFFGGSCGHLKVMSIAQITRIN